MSAAVAASRTTLTFDGTRFDLAQQAVTLGAARSWPSGWTVAGSLGLVVDGSIDRGDERHDLGPGPLAAVSLSRQWTRRTWFVNGTASASGSRVGSAAPSAPLTALDVRVGATAGRTFGPVSPYLLARGFGGPVFWTLAGDGATGTDVHHFQLGAGASLAAGPATFIVDVSALGEQAVSLAVSVRR